MKICADESLELVRMVAAVNLNLRSESPLPVYLAGSLYQNLFVCCHHQLLPSSVSRASFLFSGSLQEHLYRDRTPCPLACLSRHPHVRLLPCQLPFYLHLSVLTQREAWALILAGTWCSDGLHQMVFSMLYPPLNQEPASSLHFLHCQVAFATTYSSYLEVHMLHFFKYLIIMEKAVSCPFLHSSSQY